MSPAARLAPIITRLVEPPKVGRWYRVPAIRIDRTHGEAPFFIPHQGNGPNSHLESVLWWPVIGRQHNDKEHFNFEETHYHIDLRFITNAHLKQTEFTGKIGNMTRRMSKLHYFAASPLHQSNQLKYFGDVPPLPKPVLMPFQMKRQTPAWAYHETPVMKKFQAHFAGQQCRSSKAGFVCPHQNFPLSQMHADEGGIITCPLHGLRIHGETGVVVGASA